MIDQSAQTTSNDVYVGAQPLRLYLLQCVCLLNSGWREIHLIGVGHSISRAFECAHNLSKFTGVKIGKASMHLMKREIKNLELTCVDIPVAYDGSGQESDGDEWSLDNPGSSDVFPLQFPIAEMLLKDVLFRAKKINVRLKGDISLDVFHDSHTGFHIKSSHWKYATQVDSGFGSSLMRAGMLISPSLQPVSDSLGEFDDIVLGIDINILYSCILTNQLIDGFVLNSPESHKMTPDWILLAIPQAVMYQLECAANHRDSYGKLTRTGRKGFRALGEIFQMHTLDISGLSIVVCGKAERNSELYSEVSSLRQDMHGMRNDFMLLRKNEVDALNENQHDGHIPLERNFMRTTTDNVFIRTQFKEFLHNTHFVKGKYFLTSDRVNYGLARTESIHSLYYESVGDMYQECRHSLQSSAGLGGHKLCDVSIAGESRPICTRVALVRLLYELATEYGGLKLSWCDDYGSQSVNMRTDEHGRLDDWVDDMFYMPGGHKIIKQLSDRYAGLSVAKMLNLWDQSKSKINV